MRAEYYLVPSAMLSVVANEVGGDGERVQFLRGAMEVAKGYVMATHADGAMAAVKVGGRKPVPRSANVVGPDHRQGKVAMRLRTPLA
jgi:hypothetical protein